MNVTARFGQVCALAAFVAATGYAVAQLAQIAGLLHWPWDDIAIYGTSFCIAWPFMLAMSALHRLTPPPLQVWSGTGQLFAGIYAGFATLMYGVQLGSALPLRLAGHPNPLFAVDRYSLFWAIDAMAYISMGLGTLVASGALPSGSWVRRFFLANGILTAVIALVYFYPHFSVGLLLIGTPWIITAPGAMLLLARWFARTG